jgi:hypothetical protein
MAGSQTLNRVSYAITQYQVHFGCVENGFAVMLSA